MKILFSLALTDSKPPMTRCVCWMEIRIVLTVPGRRPSAWCAFLLCLGSTSLNVTVTTMRRGPFCQCPGLSYVPLLKEFVYSIEISILMNCNLSFMHDVFSFCRAFRGKHITLIVRFPNQGRQVDDLDIWSHTNDTIGSVRRCILNRIKANSAHTKIELFIGGDIIDPADDRKLIGQLNLKDKTVKNLHLFFVFVNILNSDCFITFMPNSTELKLTVTVYFIFLSLSQPSSRRSVPICLQAQTAPLTLPPAPLGTMATTIVMDQTQKLRAAFLEW